MVTLHNGKYLLLEWVPESQHCSLLDQGNVFPKSERPAHMVAVNKDASLVVTASVNWEVRIFGYKMGIRGLKLVQALYI